jgi:hypothetical protein
MAYTFDESIVSDLHKDAYGSRPTSGWWDCWNFQNDEGKQAAWNTLLDDLERSIETEKLADAAALATFTDLVYETMNLGAGDVVTAIKWIIQGEKFTKFDLMYGADYFCFNFNLNYSVKNSFPIQEAIDEVLASLEESV